MMRGASGGVGTGQDLPRSYYYACSAFRSTMRDRPSLSNGDSPDRTSPGSYEDSTNRGPGSAGPCDPHEYVTELSGWST